MVDKLIIVLRRAKAMEVNRLIDVQRLEFLFFTGRRIAAVIKPGAIFRPGQARELEPVQFVPEHLAGVDFHNARFAPVGPTILDHVSNVLAVRARRIRRQRHGAIVGPGVRVDEHSGLGSQAVLHVNNALILQPAVVAIEVMAALFDGQAVTAVVPQLGEPLLDEVSFRDRIKVGESDRVLALDPACDRFTFAHIVFQPAIRISNVDTVVGIDVLNRRGRRVLQFWLLRLL